MSALSKNTTYGQVIDAVRLRTNTLLSPIPTDSLIIKEISFAVQKWLKRLQDFSHPSVAQTISTNTSIAITGSANPYSMDLSSVNPYPYSLIRVVHITSGGTRTLVQMFPSYEAEARGLLTSTYATSIWGSYEGDNIRLYKGSSFTITTASDTTELKYYRQATVASVTTASYLDIPDAYVPTVITEVTASIMPYVGMDNTKELLRLEKDFEAIKGGQ